MALAPLLLLTRRAGPGRAFGLGLAFGIGFFGVLLAWISLIGWLAWCLLVGLQALFVAGFAWLWSWIARRLEAVARIAAAGVLWVTFEYLRSIVPLDGFTWGQLAQSQHELSWLLRLAAVGGGWLVSFVVVGVNALFAEAIAAIAEHRLRTAAACVAATAVTLVLPAVLPVAEVGERGVRVAIVQGNIPPEADRLELYTKELGIIRRHQRLTGRLADRGIDLVVWPESSVGLDLERVEPAGRAVAAAARAVDAPMIVGGNLDAGQDRYRVMAFEVSSEGEVVDRYQKTHLVPFGEYVPARRLLGWAPGLEQVPRDAIAGSDPVVFDVAGGKVAPVISFEGDFGSLVRQRIDGGGRLLVVATNTSTWGRSWASAQHLAFSQVRAAENGVWVVHAALTGISGFVRPDGVVVAATPLWRGTTLVRDVSFAEDVTLYARLGDWVPLACVLGSVLAAARAAVGRRRTFRVA